MGVKTLLKGGNRLGWGFNPSIPPEASAGNKNGFSTKSLVQEI